MTETPNLSNVFTVYGRCSILPALSASKIKGLVVTSKRSPIELNLEEKSKLD